MRSLIISLPPLAIVSVLLVFFAAVCFGARSVVLRRCGAESREELADQATNLLTGAAATFAFFVGFAISISWGAVAAGQNAVEQQATAVQQLAWEIRNIPDPAVREALTGKLRDYASVAANQDTGMLARGVTVGLPSAAALEDLETALHAYVYRNPEPREATGLMAATSAVVTSSASVAAVANRTVPQPLVALLFIVAVLVSAVMGISTVMYGRPSMIFIFAWCLIPALSLTVVLALAYPFALRTGLPLASLRMVAQSLV